MVCLSLQLVNFAARPPRQWDGLFEVAAAADRAGIGRVVVADHVVMGENLEAYGDPARGGIAGGRQPTGPDGAWLEPLTLLAMIGARTERVRLGTSILIAALRRPVVLAKTAATIDVLTAGRLDLGVGVGWQAEEYAAAGLDYATRGNQLDQTLEVCQLLWSSDRAGYAGDGLAFDGIHQMPKPLRGDIPIWVSGSVNPRSMARLARFGSGWIPWGPAMSDIVSGIVEMRRALRSLGRDPTGIEVVGGLPVAVDASERPDPAATMAAVPDLIAAGVSDFRIRLRPPPGQEAATEYFSEWVAALEAVSN